MAALEEKELCAPLGDPPHIEVRLKPAEGAKASCIYLGALSRVGYLKVLSTALSQTIDLPSEAIMVTYEGRTLDHGKTLTENGVHLPGPAARRAGAKVELQFDTDLEVVEQVRRHAQMLETEAEKARLRREETQRREEEAARRKEEAARRKEEAARRWMRMDGDFDEYLERVVGCSRWRAEAMVPEPDAPQRQHFLEPCPEELCASIERLMNLAGNSGSRGYQVVRVLQTDNRLLMERYQRAKEGLRQGSITRRSTTTSSYWQREAFAFPGGSFDLGINEFPMWHATPTLAAAGSICDTGFDIAYAGTNVGSAFSPGFYFADSTDISHTYAKNPWTVNEKYCNLHVMLLCRVLCGNLLESPSMPSELEKERLTAECLGPGGTFGARANYHCVLGGGWAYVCMHRDQVYPAFMIIYKR
mmetsp:Transcript_60304/g.166917  ORF Transcript_60304/g.166917 Transcript_60304/m.166917 type:complete len:417 (-) Transcript_60304:119-1369(-)